MNDTDWNSAGYEEPKRGMPTWAKVLLGCLGGCALLVVVLVLSCVGFASWVSKDPEGFGRRVEGWVKHYAGEQWRAFREAAEALQTEAGTKQLYARSPGLKDAYPTEADFLKAAREWRPLLEPVPVDLPMKHGDMQFNQQGRNTYVIGYRNSKGTRLRMTFEGGALLRITVRPGEPRIPAPVEPAEPEPPAATQEH